LWNSGNVNTGLGSTTSVAAPHSGFSNTGTGVSGFFNTPTGPGAGHVSGIFNKASGGLVHGFISGIGNTGVPGTVSGFDSGLLNTGSNLSGSFNGLF
jgi:hypothetical protein